MKKIYFLISAFMAFLIPSLISTSVSSDTNTMINDDQINVASGKYLNLTYQNGRFYSWNKDNIDDQHIIGIFDTDDQSYLLDNFGVFWNLDFQINNFYRVSNTQGIANIEYFKNQNNNEYFNQSFIVTLNQNAVVITDTPLTTNNSTFVLLDDTHAVSYGIGLDLIDMTNNSVNNVIPPYENGSDFSTSFYPITSTSGIFVGDDQNYYLLNDVNSNQKTQIPLRAPNSKNNVVTINSSILVIRAEANTLHFVTIGGSVVTVNDWVEQDENNSPISSKANNFAFSLSDDTFILNTSFGNSSSRYGKPYLIKTTAWDTLNEIPNIQTIDDFMIINDNNGILIDKDLQASSFSYQSSDDSFSLDPFGILNNIQFVKNNLFFGSISNNNLLLTQETNSDWSIMSNITFSARSIRTNTNLLNNMIITENTTINYQNSYFSDGPIHINITDLSLREMVVESTTSPTRRLRPERNTITYDFLNFDNYQVTINFSGSSGIQNIKYRVNIQNFNNQDLVNVSGTNIVSYVGVSKNKLYDINVIDQAATFTIGNYNYDYLQYAELYIYADPANIVAENKYNLKNNTEISFSDQANFFGIKMANLLNQKSWLYLGFKENNEEPMVDFWDTGYGKKLMNQAMGHRYLDRDLRKMNSQQITELIRISRSWTATAVQGKSVVITMAVIFGLTLFSIVISIGANVFLDKQIEIKEVEKNKILKNPLDA